MKRKGLLLSLATLGVSFTAVAFILNMNNSSSPLKVEASSRERTAGLFYKVEDVSDIHIGDKIIFVSYGGYVLDESWGNPAYLHGTRDGIIRTSSHSLAFLESCSGTLFTVEEGMLENTYSFRGSMSIGGIYKEDIYLAQNRKDYFGDDTFGDIGSFFEDGFGIEDHKSNDNSLNKGSSNTNWLLIPLENDGVTIEHIKGGRMSFSPNLSDAFIRNPSMFGHYPYITRQTTYIYKQISQSETTSYTLSFLENMDKTDYIHGEEINLEGLKINLRIVENSHETFNENFEFKYNKSMFTYPKFAYGNGPTTISCTFAGQAFTRDIYVSRENESAGKVTESLHDYRGTFMLVVANGTDSIGLSGKVPSVGTNLEGVFLSSPYGKDDRRIASDSDNDSYIRFEIDRDNDGGFNYVLKCKGNNKYLQYGTYLTYSDTADTTWERFNFEYDGNGVRIKSDDEYLYYDGHGYFQFGAANEGMPVYLWKYGTTDEEFSGLNTFVNHFLSSTDVCDPTGVTNRITKSTWTTLQAEFESLSVEAQGVLANLTYEKGASKPRTIEDMVERYDYIVAKYLYYGDAPEESAEYVIEDFIHRLLGGVNPYSGDFSSNNRFNLFSNDNSTAIIIICVASVTLISLAGLFIYKKKKQK